MELNQDTRTFRTPQVIADSVAEQLADADITLPDYCPNIEKILKCTLTPKIQTRTLSGGQLQVEGFCVITVLYVDGEKKTIRCCEQNVNFSQSFSVRDTPENYVILTKTKSEYINCRALSPRRLVIHGAFSLYAKVIAAKTNTLYTSDDPTLETRKMQIRCADLKSLCQEQFTVSEEISSADKPAVESLLYSSVTAAVTECKSVTGKLMVNGEINLKMFYLTDIESGQTAKTEYIIPFSQVIDCEGAEDENRCVLDCEVLSYEIRLKNDVLSEKPMIALDAKICVTQEGFLPRDEYLITDAYSTKYCSVPSFENVKVIADTVPVSESFIEKITAKIDNCQISKLLDIYPGHITLDTSPTDDGIKACGKINMCIVALNEDEFPVFIERSFEYSHPISAADCNAMIFPSVRMSSVSYRLADDNSVELRCEMKLSGGAVNNESYRAVSGVEVNKDQPLETDDCALTLYYAAEGESLWDIAKSHKTGLDLLLAENELEESTVERPQMLLIPKI